MIGRKVDRKKNKEKASGSPKEAESRKEKAPFPLREPGLVGASEPVWRSSRNEHISDLPLHSYCKNG